jgi:predicted nucleic acid-binding protein
VRTGRLDGKAAADLLDCAERILTGVVALPHSSALAVAAEFGVSAYDARFLAIARQLGAKLVTEDTKLRQAAPGMTQSAQEALASP